jgi:integrase
MARLREVIAPESPDNPWISDHAKKRNELAIRWIFELGLRRGELLNIKVDPDINFTREEVTIARRADDPEDPRRNQPRVKTRDRKLPLSRELCAMTNHYVIKVRSKLSGARKHAFLFVADKTGKPLSMSALNKSFVVLRKKCPGLPDTLSPHVGRHSWNDGFSKTMDEQRISEADEKKLRSYQMGWSETSGTAAIYTRRHTREKAQKVSLKMQADQAKGVKNDE